MLIISKNPAHAGFLGFKIKFFRFRVELLVPESRPWSDKSDFGSVEMVQSYGLDINLKGGDPSAPSSTDTLLRLNPHR